MESLVTQEKIKAFIASLDMTDASVKSILASLQFLHPQYLEQVMFYLSEDLVNINQLYGMDINNNSIKIFLKSVEENTNSYISYKNIYQAKLDSLPGYKEYLKNKKSNTLQLMIRQLINISSPKYTTFFMIDEYNIKSNTFKSINTVNQIYDDIFFKSEIQILISQVSIRANEIQMQYGLNGLADFCGTLINQIGEYAFISNVDGKEIEIELGTDSILGFIAREQYYDLPYMNLLNNMNFILNEMAQDYTKDTSKSGVYTVKKLMTDFSLTNIFKANIINREDKFLTDLVRIIFIRYVFMCQVYGASYFTAAEIQLEKDRYTAIISLFELINSLCMEMIHHTKLAYPKI